MQVLNWMPMFKSAIIICLITLIFFYFTISKIQVTTMYQESLTGTDCGISGVLLWKETGAPVENPPVHPGNHILTHLLMLGIKPRLHW